MTEQPKYAVGDPVWSKMKGYCPWPSRIADQSESNLKNTAADKLKAPKVHYLVYFFGSNNFAWMPEDTIKPYEEYKEKNKKGSKTTQFKQGLEQIEEYINNGGKATLAAHLTSAAAIKNDDATSPSAAGDSLSNDASNPDDDLPTIDDELAVIKKTPASSSAASKKLKNSNDSQNDSTSLTSPVSVQRDYSRTPFKSRKTARSEDTTNDIISPIKRGKITDDDSHGSSSHLSNTTVPSFTITSSRSQLGKSGSAARTAILRTQAHDMPPVDTPRINFNSITLKSKNIVPSTLKFGFIGVGFLGGRLLKCLLETKHNVTIYNRTTSKTKEFIEAGAIGAQCPLDVINDTDIVFLSLPDPQTSKDVVFGSFGLLAGADIVNKGIIELSSIDPETSKDLSEAITSRGGRYLEAPAILSGRQSAEDGEMVILAAGSKDLYDDASTCFKAMAKKSFFVSHDIGNASKMNIIVSMLYGAIVGAVTEGTGFLARLASLSNNALSTSDMREILELSSMNCPLVLNTMDRVMHFETAQPWQVQVPMAHLQKDLRFGLAMAETIRQPTPITCVTNELFKAGVRAGMGEADAANIYGNLRF